MSEENKESLENEELNETADSVEENAEEVIEEAVETAEEAVEEAVEEADEVTEDAAEAAEVTADAAEGTAEEAAEAFGDIAEDAPEVKKSRTGLIVGIIAAVVIVIIAVLAVLFGKNLFNKYNRMGYIDVSGKTIAEIADESGYELADFLAEFELPADMPGNTSESAAYYNIPVRKIAQMYGMDFAQMKEMFVFDESITEDTTWGVAEGEITVANYVGEENLDQFKQQYEFGDEVTGETKWKEIRNILDQKSRDERIAAEKAAAEAETATEAPAEGEATEAPAEGEATEAPAAE